MILGAGRNLRIGGVDLAVSAPPSLRLRVSDPHYRPFIAAAAAGGGDLRIPLRLKEGPWPEFRQRLKIFDTQDSWSLGRDGKRIWISLSPLPHESPLWMARFDRRLGRVDLYCRVPGGGGKRATVDLPLVYPLDQLLLMYFLATRRGLLLHAAGMVRRGGSFLFAGASGAGKSTISGLLARARAGRILSDERMIVREIDGKMIAFGTPWAGTAGIARNGAAPLAGIFFLEQAKTSGIARLDPAPALDRLLPLVSIPWYDHETMAAIIAFAKRALARIPAYEFRFTPDGSAIDFFLKFMENASF